MARKGASIVQQLLYLLQQLLVQEINRLLQRDPECVGLKQVSSITVDHFLWDFRREHDIKINDAPFHHTRCIYY